MERRKQLNLTQKQVSDAVGVTTRTVQSWELRENLPRLTLDKVLILCNTLQCSLEELVSWFYAKPVDLPSESEDAGNKAKTKRGVPAKHSPPPSAV
ncbi:MAG: helix-turn-helix domain-containing protein [Tildeniella torsiva UHER 1998/13D]|nr:helix-turn-helix domain-containing protein [Tildeniella torsiva UHER 1998/13D]